MEYKTEWEPIRGKEDKIVGYWVTTRDEQDRVVSMIWHGPTKQVWRGWFILSRLSLYVCDFWGILTGLCPFRFPGELMEKFYWFLYDDVHKYFFYRSMGY